MQIPNAVLHAIELYLAGNATAEEQLLVHKWYYSFKDDEVEIPVNIIELRTKVAQRIWARLAETVQNTEQETLAPVVPLNRRSWFRVSAAAAVILLFTMGLYFYTGKNKENALTSIAPAKPAKHDVDPGGDKAILILSDGRRIILDSAANGMLSVQGNCKVVKMADGQVVYNADNIPAAENFPVTYNTLETPKGGQYKLTLPDGSEVWLNAASSIRYPTVFTGNERKVEITGEVYFEVRSAYAAGNSNGKKMPFVVVFGSPSTPALDDRRRIEVVGTHFNVMAYDDETIMKTTLLEGIIKIQSSIGLAKERDESILRPGQQADITQSLPRQSGDSRLTIHDSNDPEEAIAWKNGIFQFKDTDIETIMRQLSRWYDIDVMYSGNIPSMKLTGKAPRNISLASMLKILALSDVKYEIQGKVLTIMP